MRYAILKFNYIAEDTVENLSALDHLIFAHVDIESGVTVNSKDFSGLPYLSYFFPWPRDGWWDRGILALF